MSLGKAVTLVGRLVGLAGLGAALLWLIATRSLPGGLAGLEPRRALQLNAREPVALLASAETKLAALAYWIDAQSPDRQSRSRLTQFASPAVVPQLPSSSSNAASEFGEALAPEAVHARAIRIREIAHEVLRQDPMSAAALRLTGLAAELQSGAKDGPAVAAPFIAMAARRSAHDAPAVAWMLVDAERSGRMATAADLVGKLVQARPDLMGLAASVLARAAMGAQRAAVVGMLAQDPPWRGSVLKAMPRSGTETHATLMLLLDLKDSASPPSERELGAYIEQLSARGEYELAYYAWLQHLRPEQLAQAGFLFNGSFSFELSAMPFDWSLPHASEAGIRLVVAPDLPGRRSLVVEPQRLEAARVVASQVTVLSAGAYRLSLQVKGDVSEPPGIDTHIACVGGAPLARAALPRPGKDWRSVETDFDIPAAGCSAQVVEIVGARLPDASLRPAGALSLTGLKIARRER